MNLRECLSRTPYRELLVIAELRQVDPGRHPPKQALVDRLVAPLLDAANVRRTLRSLSDAERQALDALIAAGGSLPWPRFRQRFGEIRPYKPWQPNAPRHPWRSPISPAERLASLGLIFLEPRRPRAGDTVAIVIPDDLLASLPAVEPFTVAGHLESQRLSWEPAQGDVLQDVALLISLVHRQDIQPLHGCWLPPRSLHDLNRRLSLPEDLSGVRSELQTGSLRFVHFLAESAGLLDLVTGRLAPTPQAWSWLDAPQEQQYSRLWEAWQAPRDAQRVRWQRYRLPGAEQTDPLALLAHLLARLAQCPAGRAFDLADFTRLLVEDDHDLWNLTPWWELEAGRDRTREVIAGLVTGPLRWWGVVTVDNSTSATRFAVTPLGAWLLTGSGDRPSNPDIPFALEDDLTITVSPGVSPRTLLRLEAFAGLTERRGDTLCYQITSASLTRALGRGISLDEILVLLGEEAAGELRPDHRTRLEAWADAADDVRLHPVTLLETRTAAQMAELTRHRSLRRSLRRTLSPRAVVVNEPDVGSLRRTLEKLGVHVKSTVPAPAAGKAASPPPPQNWGGRGGGAAVYLLIAGRVYGALGRWINLPQPLPAALLDDLTARLDPPTVAAAHQAADDVLNALAQAIDGWTPSPLPGRGLPPAETRPLIEEAIAHDRSLEITYWSAGRGQLTRRTVDPYRIEWRGNVPYLIGYCHEQGDERIFRLDRIQSLELR